MLIALYFGIGLLIGISHGLFLKEANHERIDIVMMSIAYHVYLWPIMLMIYFGDLWAYYFKEEIKC